ncbi:hypothetical protein [Egicoccus sp. AB-alg2]|uniref:hypothetical protein n=1 Tax=Egicoccus sp. AB-alg2 TaxID=3242693 RepID=UPI00359EC5A1
MAESGEPAVQGQRRGLRDAAQAAHADLGRIRGTLTEEQRAASPSRALVTLVAHWRDHRPVYQTLARLVGDEAREAIIRELEGWKRELDEQLGTSERSVEASVRRLESQLAASEPGIGRAELLIELAELHASRQDDREAQRRFHAAEEELAPHQPRTTGAGIADVLVDALPGVLQGEAPRLRAELEAVIRTSKLLQRVYDGLARVVQDPAEAKRYLDRRRELDMNLAPGTQEQAEFKRRLLDGLAQAGEAPTDEEAGRQAP